MAFPDPTNVQARQDAPGADAARAATHYQPPRITSRRRASDATLASPVLIDPGGGPFGGQ